MILISQSSAALAGAALALLVIGATWALWTGLRARADAAAMAEDHVRFNTLVSGSPAQAMIVRADGRIEMPRRLADWLGLQQIPRELDALAGGEGGLMPEDL
ncbi:MAG: histidine kinase, partial [Sphingomonadales bacterium]